MRSLVILSAQLNKLVSADAGQDEVQVCSLTTDAATNSLYAIAQQPNRSANATLSLFRFNVTDPNIQSENDSLSVVLANGDIEQLFDPSSAAGLEQRRENVGAVDAGIKAAVWSPDEELLALVTGDDKLVVMTKDYEVLSEGPLHSTDFGEDAPVTVGWGEKSTQFHGSVGKSAATAPTTSPPTSFPSPSPSDDQLPRISWRGDSAFFTVSSTEHVPSISSSSSNTAASPRRTLRIFSRVGVLSSTGEPTLGLEGVLAWQPSGSIIAASQKTLGAKEGEEGSHQIIFFERNGLRRYEFALREEERGKTGSVVKELAWNSESTLLAVWLERAEGHVVQIWHRNNYHWYLKQEISPRLSGGGNVTSVVWHPENGLDLYLTTTTKVNLTPFRIVNIPPPMSATSLTSTRPSRVPSHIAFSPESGSIVALYPDAFVEIWAWNLHLGEAGKRLKGVVEAPLMRRSFSASEGHQDVYATQCACIGSGENLVVAVLLKSRSGSRLVVVGKDGKASTVKVPGGVTRLVAGEGRLLLQGKNGEICEVSTAALDGDLAMPSETIPGLVEHCPWIRHVTLPTSSTIIGLTSSGRIYSGDRLVASDATSFTCTTEFLIFTTFSHQARFVSLFSLEGEPTHVESLRKPEASNDGTIKRNVERGSKIVTVVPSSTSLVLQMPRGNLETVCPRPLVLRIVRQDLDRNQPLFLESRSRYRAAFLSCRRHRIDLNILYDHNPQSFLANLPDFINQIKDVDYLNLFLSGLKNEDVTLTMYKPLLPSGIKPADASTKINMVCDLVRAELEKRDVFHYANTILTTHVRQQPPDYESALRVLVDLKSRDAERAEEAVKYIIFLSDANKLFDLALGLYDFPLVLMIAQQSQKDPREYLPFLRELRQLDTHLQRFKIDDHLERHDSAVRNLALTGSERFDEVVAYVELHGLYATALDIYRDDVVKYKVRLSIIIREILVNVLDDETKVILVANADYLSAHRKNAEAGLLYALGGQPGKAIESYHKASAWQELFTLALTEKRSGSEIKALAVTMAENLKAKNRHPEAGRVLQEYGRDIDGAVSALVEGNAYIEAIRLTSLYSRRDLIDTQIKPGALEAQVKIMEDIEELTEQVEKQVERLAELKERRDANPNLYYCLDAPMSALDNLELQPDGASDAGTAFTRYTAAGQSVATTQLSSRTSKSRRRGQIKKAAGKKGSIYEEAYLLKSLKKSFEGKLDEIQTDTAALIPALLSLATTAHRSAAVEVQAALSALESSLATQLETIWVWRETEWAEEKAEEVAAKDRGEIIEKREVEEGLERVERPKLSTTRWKSSILIRS
ncbi:elongator complex protein 1, partial [Phenoliferia sp. Uapishka_3]